MSKLSLIRQAKELIKTFKSDVKFPPMDMFYGTKEAQLEWHKQNNPTIPLKELASYRTLDTYYEQDSIS